MDTNTDSYVNMPLHVYIYIHIYLSLNKGRYIDISIDAVEVVRRDFAMWLTSLLTA